MRALYMGMALALAFSTAPSQIIYHEELKSSIALGSFFIDLNGDEINDVWFGFDVAQSLVNPLFDNKVAVRIAGPLDLGGNVLTIPVGTEIGPGLPKPGERWDLNGGGLTFFFTTGAGGSFFGQHAYVAVEFLIAGRTHYGWIEYEDMTAFRLPGEPEGPLFAGPPAGVVRGWAYEATPDTAIVAGAIPEPGALALLALGGWAAAGWAARRRRR